MFLKDGNAITHSLSPYQHHSRFARKFIYICFTICKTNFFRICGTHGDKKFPDFRRIFNASILSLHVNGSDLLCTDKRDSFKVGPLDSRALDCPLCHGQVWSQRWRHDLGSIILTLLNKAHLISITRRLNVRLCLRE